MSRFHLERGWLARQLPRPLAEDPFLQRFTLIFETIVDSVRGRVSGFEYYLDPSLAPPEFVRWTAGWLGLAVDPSLPERRQRNLLRAAGPLFAWRGTARGLQGLLEAFTDQDVEILDRGGIYPEGTSPAATEHVVVRLAGSGGLSEDHLRELIELELPAHATFELRITGEEPGLRGAGSVSPQPGEDPRDVAQEVPRPEGIE
jgi:phage tail-like protein